MIDHPVHRALFDESEAVAGRPVRISCYVDHFFLLEQVRYLDMNLGEAHGKYGALACVHVHAPAAKHEITGNIFDVRPARGVIERATRNARGHLEHASLPVREREFVEVTLQPQRVVVRLARAERGIQPLAGFRADYQRYVPARITRIRPREVPRDVDDAARGARGPVIAKYRSGNV